MSDNTARRYSQVPDSNATARALLLVDVQKNMLDPPEPVPDAPAVAAAIDRLLAGARSTGAIAADLAFA